MNRLMTVVGCILMTAAVGRAEVIAQLRFDKASADGMTVTDISGNGHDASWSDGVTLNPDDPFNLSASKSVEFDGTRYGQLADPADINMRADGARYWSMEAWVKWDGTANPWKEDEDDMRAGIIGIEGVTTSSGSTYLSLGIRNGQVSVSVVIQGGGGMGWAQLTAPTDLAINSWTHVALVATDGNILRLYVDGEQVDSFNYGRDMPAGSQWARIGYSHNHGYFSGLIDDVRFTSNSLAPEELGYHASFTPEPMTITFLTIGGGLLMNRRRR